MAPSRRAAQLNQSQCQQSPEVSLNRRSGLRLTQYNIGFACPRLNRIWVILAGCGTGLRGIPTMLAVNPDSVLAAAGFQKSGLHLYFTPSNPRNASSRPIRDLCRERRKSAVNPGAYTARKVITLKTDQETAAIPKNCLESARPAWLRDPALFNPPRAIGALKFVVCLAGEGKHRPALLFPA